MLKGNIDYFKSKPVNIPKITILLDNGYHSQKLEEQLKKVYPQIMNKIRFKLSPKPSIEQKQKAGKTGFVPVQARWVIERTNSWMERCKSLVKNFERTLAHATTKVNLCFVRADASEIGGWLNRSQMGSIQRIRIVVGVDKFVNVSPRYAVVELF